VTNPVPDFGEAALPPSLLQAFLEESRDLLVLTDAIGTVAWTNSRFADATGFVPGAWPSRC
jgi:PAS domain-containing protein